MKNQQNTTIIGVSGKMESGKDEIGKMIQYFTYGADKANIPYQKWDGDTVWGTTDTEFYISTWEIKKFADKLKDIVCLLTGCTREELENREFKEKELGEEWWYYLVEDKSRKSGVKLIPYIDNENKYNIEFLIKLTRRKILQLLGTECGRDIIHPNIWCSALFSEYYGDVELWKTLKNYEGRYEISNFGRVKSLNRITKYGNKKGEYHTVKEKVLKSTVTGSYEMIRLERNNSVTIHRLVAKHFITKVKKKLYVNHIDHNPLNNFYKNLEWCTPSENILCSIRAGNGTIGVKQVDHKLNEKLVLEIRKHLKDRKYKQIEIAKLYNVSATTITDIKKGRKWSHIGKNYKKPLPILPIKSPNWCITDCRFPNEADAIKRRNGILIRVNRTFNKAIETDNGDGSITLSAHPNVTKINIHPSETALDNYEKFDYTIDNDGSLEDLLEKVRVILKKENII